MEKFQAGTNDLGELNDKISSLWNRTVTTWCAYSDVNATGIPMSVCNWRGNLYGLMNDNISSLHPGRC